MTGAHIEIPLSINRSDFLFFVQYKVSNLHFQNKIFQIKKNDERTIGQLKKIATFERIKKLVKQYNQYEKLCTTLTRHIFQRLVWY